MNKILDLRFVIGVFFTLIGLLLFGYSFNDTGEWNLNKTIGWGYENHTSINRWCGIVFGVFGIAMILLSFMKDANDELISKK
jgi:hypothetical protein